jgi:hypothetical protein
MTHLFVISSVEPATRCATPLVDLSGTHIQQANKYFFNTCTETADDITFRQRYAAVKKLALVVCTLAYSITAVSHSCVRL